MDRDRRAAPHRLSRRGRLAGRRGLGGRFQQARLVGKMTIDQTIAALGPPCRQGPGDDPATAVLIYRYDPEPGAKDDVTIRRAAAAQR
jgi:hypothetical protein